jgi:hypothetical protein
VLPQFHSPNIVPDETVSSGLTVRLRRPRPVVALGPVVGTPPQSARYGPFIVMLQHDSKQAELRSRAEITVLRSKPVFPFHLLIGSTFQGTTPVRVGHIDRRIEPYPDTPDSPLNPHQAVVTPDGFPGGLWPSISAWKPASAAQRSHYPHQACLGLVLTQPRSHPATVPPHRPPSSRPGTVRPSSCNRCTPRRGSPRFPRRRNGGRQEQHTSGAITRSTR